MMPSVVRVLALFLLLVPAVAIRRASNKQDEYGPSSKYRNLKWEQHFSQYMDDLAATANPKGLYPSCTPVHQGPAGKSRGLIVLQHGYTACAGFWYLMVPRLVEEGWTVLAPNMPGHGRAPTVESDGDSFKVMDYYQDLPEKPTEYEAFALELVEIGRKFKEDNKDAEMVFVGCSHGGAMAMEVAMKSKRDAWDRVMLLNPFLAPPVEFGTDFGIDFMADIFPKVLPAFEVVGGYQVSWGAECEEAKWPSDPRHGGHGGLCQANLNNFAAVFEFGQYVWENLDSNRDVLTPNFKVQVLTSSNDGAISNSRVHSIAEAIEQSPAGPHSGFCGLLEEFTHTWINPIDKDPNEDMWWLDPKRVSGGKSAMDMLVDFASQGIVFPTDGTINDDPALMGDPRCALKKR